MLGCVWVPLLGGGQNSSDIIHRWNQWARRASRLARALWLVPLDDNDPRLATQVGGAVRGAGELPHVASAVQLVGPTSIACPPAASNDSRHQVQ